MTSVYYTTVMDNVTTKVILEPDANGVYNFKMPAAEAWLHIECTQNVFNVTTKGDGNETVTASPRTRKTPPVRRRWASWSMWPFGPTRIM